MPTRRQSRINDLMLESLSLLIPGGLDDPRVVDATVTRVETTQDLSTAKVYITGAGTENAWRSMHAGLQHAEGRLRAELADLGLRRLPHLVFARDLAYESGERVMAILSQLELEHPPSETDAADRPGREPQD